MKPEHTCTSVRFANIITNTLNYQINKHLELMFSDMLLSWLPDLPICDNGLGDRDSYQSSQYNESMQKLLADINLVWDMTLFVQL